jgi:hypothetical protein
MLLRSRISSASPRRTCADLQKGHVRSRDTAVPFRSAGARPGPQTGYSSGRVRGNGSEGTGRTSALVHDPLAETEKLRAAVLLFWAVRRSIQHRIAAPRAREWRWPWRAGVRLADSELGKKYPEL